MALRHVYIIKILPLTLLLAGCASLSGDWPNLGEPYPDAGERERVVEHAQPSPPTVFNDASPLNKSVAIKLLVSVRARLEKATDEYQAILVKLQGAGTATDLELQKDLWNEAQLALTRLSHTVSQLDAILITEPLRRTGVWENARKLKEQQDLYLTAERKLLGHIGVRP